MNRHLDRLLRMRELVRSVDRSLEEARRRRLGIPAQPVPQALVAGRMRASRLERRDGAR
ncbi:MAG TPA: hypothetical protein PKC43_01950 [Phycisphaerales bacterium]|nr:hypothetical protein [Phycisphaerales bacterium]HMP36188.1 hypothetical protein [Phycisphaerales bacterium]